MIYIAESVLLRYKPKKQRCPWRQWVKMERARRRKVYTTIKRFERYLMKKWHVTESYATV